VTVVPDAAADHAEAMAADVTRNASMQLAILAGSGRAPIEVADAAIAAGHTLHILALRGVADPDIVRFQHTWVGLGQVGAMLRTLARARSSHMIIIGGLTRPNLWHVMPDWGFVRHFTSIANIMRGGDDAVLRRVIAFFESNGVDVVGVPDVAPAMLASNGQIAGPALGLSEQMAVGRARAALQAMSALDAGQACVATPDGVLALEDGAGTSRLLGSLSETSLPIGDGVLVKQPKRGQELRVDMPAIGPETIEQVRQLKGVAVAAGRTVLVSRAHLIAQADEAGVTVTGFDADRELEQSPSPAAHAPVVVDVASGDDRKRAEDLARIASAHVAAAVTDLGVIVRRGHPYAILTNGLRDQRWPTRLAAMTPLKWLGVIPSRRGHFCLWSRTDTADQLTDAALIALARALYRSGIASASVIGADAAFEARFAAAFAEGNGPRVALAGDRSFGGQRE